MRKVFVLMLISLFVLSSFIGIFSSASASELIEDSWATKAPLPHARAGLGVVAVDGKIYAIGGSTSNNVDVTVNDGVDLYVDYNECYDPVSDTWVTLTSMPAPRAGFAIAAYEGKIYCVGGVAYDKSFGGGSPCGIFEVYDIATDSWSTMDPAPVSGSGIQGHVVDGKIFVIAFGAVYMYNPRTAEWTRKSDASTNLSMPTSSVVADKIVVFGDITIKSGLSNSPPTIQGTEMILKAIIYDPTTDVWRESATETTLALVYSGAVATTGVYAPQRVYHIDIMGTNKVYDIVTDTWDRGISMPSSRQNFGVAVVDDILYVIGGYGKLTNYDDRNNYGVFSLNERYVPIGYKDAIPAHEPSNSTTSPVTTESTSPTTSEPTEVSEPTVTYIIAAVLAVTIVTFATVLFFYFKKQKKR